MPCRVARQQAAGRLQLAMMTQAGKDIRQLSLLSRGIDHAVGGEQRQMKLSSQGDGSLVARFLATVEMPLQLHVNVVFRIKANQCLEAPAASSHSILE